MTRRIFLVACLLAAMPVFADVTIDGQVQHPHRWAASDLKAQAGVQADVTYQSGKGEEHARFVGVPLWRLLSEAALVEDGKGKNPSNRHIVVATGGDDYSAILSFGEIDPEFEGKAVLVAYERDGVPLPDLQLVVPGDKRGGRYVHDLVHIEVR